MQIQVIMFPTNESLFHWLLVSIFGTLLLNPPDIYGQCCSVSFERSISYLKAGEVMPTGAYTKEAWVKVESPNGRANNIISGSQEAQHAFWIPSGTGYKVKAGHNGEARGGNWSYVTDPNPITFREWQHYAVTYDGSSIMVLYRNGKEVARKAGVPPFFDQPKGFTGKGLHIGAYLSGSRVFNLKGNLDEVRIWKTARTQEQIATYMGKGIPADQSTDLLAYYSFDDLKANSNLVSDQTSNGNNANLINFDLSNTDNFIGPGVQINNDDDIDNTVLSKVTNKANLIESVNNPKLKTDFKIETINNKTFGAFLGGLVTDKEGKEVKVSSAIMLSNDEGGLYSVDCDNARLMLVVERNGKYELIKTQKELRSTFAPIGTPEEALTFVHLQEGGLPATIFDEDDPFFNEIKNMTHIKPMGENAYQVKLIVFPPCNVHGEAVLNTYLIDKAGHVEKTNSKSLNHR